MRLKVNIGSLVDAVNQVFATADKRATSTACVYIQAVKKSADQQFLYIYSTNLLSETLTKIPAIIEEEGKVLLNPDQLIGGLQGRPRDDEIALTLESEGKKIKVAFGKAKFHVTADINVIAVENQLKKLPFTEPSIFKVNGKDMAEFIRRAQFCIPTDNTGQSNIFSCLNVVSTSTGYEGQATDNCIAVSVIVKASKAQPGELEGIKLPQASLAPLGKLLGKRSTEVINIIRYGNNKIVFKCGDTMYGTILLSGKYPNLTSVFEKKGNITFTIDRMAFKAALDRANTFRNSKGYVDIELKKAELYITTKNDSGVGDSYDVLPVMLPADVNTEEPIKIAIGIDYLSNIVSVSKSLTLKVGITGPLQPLVITDGEDEITTKYVVMGIKP